MVILFVDLHNAASSMKVLMRGKPLKTHQKTSKHKYVTETFLVFVIQVIVITCFLFNE